ncbi:MAG: hypothetical protein GOMPHAMPRED_000237 [Gomphillus americanus]|uniref:Uncharacterized protein n=1 Tax=Gomphillus americanus TaxID=1940652 RepID=A0A8H3I1B7_9LECA|nr:MAG: hypothetical protein GOMPHAMPRED_000237 [Gomphillus americanus]
MSPPQVKGKMRTRIGSSSPPVVRRIQRGSYHLAHPSDPYPAKATIAMTGPGIISHQRPSGHDSRIIVPPKKAVLQETDHSTATILKGRVFSQGTMLASASGYEVTSSYKLGRGNGVSVLDDALGKHMYGHVPQSERKYWIRRPPGHIQPVSAASYISDAGEVTVMGCNDPDWCDRSD